MEPGTVEIKTGRKQWPSRNLSCQTVFEFFDLTLTLVRTVKLLGHERAVPAENRVGLDDGGHFL
jgi:hypothetical protein